MRTVKDFGANISSPDDCQTRDEVSECTGDAEYVVWQNQNTPRQVCRQCLPGSIDFISKAVYVEPLRR